MTASELWHQSTLVRVVGEMSRGRGKPPLPFCAGLLVDPARDRVAFTAPLLSYLKNATSDQLRRHCARMGWRATIVRQP